MRECLETAVAVQGAISMSGGAADIERAAGVYHLECLAPDGSLRWAEDVCNVVTTQGKNFVLDNALAGSGYTAAWLLSLFTAGTPVATATYASPVVTEVTSSVLASRPAMTWVAASGGGKSSNAVTCSIVGSATITGVMVVKGSATIGDTATASAVLLSEGTLATSRAVLSGDTLNVTYSLSI